MKLPRRTLLALSPIAATALALATAGVAFAVAPSVTYLETGSGGGGRPTTTHITIQANPNNARVRAWERCGNGVYHLGSYHTSVGATSNTANCGSTDHVAAAGFDYGPNPVRVTCYFGSGSRSGS